MQNGKRKNSPDEAGLRQLSFLIRFALNFGGSAQAGFSGNGNGNFYPIPTLALPLKGRVNSSTCVECILEVMLPRALRSTGRCITFPPLQGEGALHSHSTKREKPR